MSVILDWIPGYVWLALVAVIIVGTARIWLPLWAIAPTWARAAGLGGLLAGLAYAFGRHTGATGAVERERKRNERAATELIDKARVARDEQRSRDAGGVRDDADPFRRD